MLTGCEYKDKLLSQWKHVFAPGMLATHDYKNMINIVKNMWCEVQTLASGMPKCKDVLVPSLKKDLKYQLEYKWDISKLTLKKLEDIHPYATVDMQTHTKMGLYETLNIVTHTIQRLRTYCKSKKSDIFGDGTNWTKKVLVSNITYLLMCDNKWHSGAVCSHLLAIMGSTYYRR